MAERRLLRCELVTPAHLGAAEGMATLDRPTQINARTGMPFLPDSALKGVLAGRFGDVPSEEERSNPTRERLFGSPDRGETPGEAGPLVLGNGELLAWRAPTRDGTTAWIVPAAAVARAMSLENRDGQDPELLQLLAAVEAVAKERRALGLPRLPALKGIESLQAFQDSTVEASPRLARLMAEYLGRNLTPRESMVVVGEGLDRELWRAASERRTLTAVDSKHKVVTSGSLRSVELVPEGAVFLSLLTYHGEVPDEGIFKDLIQLGAYEGQGLGWVRLELVAHGEREKGLGALESTPTGDAVRLGPAEVMVSVWEAVESLAGAAPEKVVATVRAAIGSFGMRCHRHGLSATVAFELAKARPADGRPSNEARAHRWLLNQVLGLKGEPLSEEGEDRALLDWLAEDPFATGWLESRRDLILLRWLWLRRYAESELGPVDPGDEP